MDLPFWISTILSGILSALCCSSCCVVVLLIAVVVGIVIFAFIQRQAINGFRKWYIQTKGTWEHRMFDNPDLKAFLKWYKWAPPNIMNDYDKKLIMKVNGLLKDELLKGQMTSGTAEHLKPKTPPGGKTEHPRPPMPSGDTHPLDQGIAIEDEVIIPIVPED